MVIKSINMEQSLIDWLIENRADFRKNFSKATVNAIKITVGPSLTAEESKAKVIAQKLAQINSSIESFALEKELLLQQMKLLERKRVKKK